MSFYTSLSGLQAAQTDMSTISNNIANVSTNGFKKSSTDFSDVMASSSTANPSTQIGSGVVVQSVRQQFSQGNFTTTSSALDLAISGDGFFVMKGAATDGGGVSYTRDGSFLIDSNRYVTDSSGNQLQVYPVDGSGTVVATGLSSTTSLQVPETSGTATPTSTVSLTMNLNSSASVPSEAFDRYDSSTYNQTTTSTVYDSDGNAQTLTNYYVKSGTADDGSSTWSVYSYIGDQQLSAGTSDDGSATPVTLTFDSDGTLTSPTSGTTLTGYTSNGSDQPITLDFGTGTTATSAAFSVSANTSDGETVGQFSGLTIGEDGAVTASFSNGDTQVLGKVVLANFSNTSGLRQLGDSSWEATGLSGDPVLGTAGSNGFGSLMSGAVEQSNVDITEELVNLIAAQRNFQANAKALDTANQLSQTIFNMQS